MKRRRVSRAFIPTNSDLARLEPIILLNGDNWTFHMTGNVGADEANVDDAKGQLAADIAAYKQDLLIYKQDVTNWKLDRNDYNFRVKVFKDDVKDFNDEYKPKKIKLSTTLEANVATGQMEPKIVLEIDLTGVIPRLLGQANDAKAELDNRRAQLILYPAKS